MLGRRKALTSLALLAIVAVSALAALGFARVDGPAAQAPPATVDAPPLDPEPRVVTTEPVKNMAATVQRRTILRRSPNGRRIGIVGRRTRFGSRQRLAVVSRRGSWLGVLHPNARGGKAGWIPADAARLVSVRWSMALDRSAQVVRVRRDGRVVRRFRVAVGRSSSPTPLGRFAITDHIKPSAGSVYGCCILAISARQERLPAGWTGGDRVAFHGSPTDSVGGAVSSGCVRMKRKALRWLMRRLPNGTRVDIVA
jgi:lipoprotein-anchoring transpeptidase ErfK/SrfK